MQQITEENELVYLIDGPDPEGMGAKQFGILKSKTEEMRLRGNNVKLAQLIKIVSSHLILGNPIFEGAKRPLNYSGDQEGSRNKLFFIFKPANDYDWNVLEDGSIELTEMVAPSNCVFVVIATPNRCGRFSSVNFWLEHWTWVDEDKLKAGYPVDSETRYEREVDRPRS